jgi:two-component system, NarL family, response regulator NreC
MTLAMVRKGLRMLLDAEPDLLVVAEAADVDAALRLAQDRQPDVIVLDLSMPGRSTLAGIPDFRRAVPDSAIVVLTMNDDASFAREALASGASAYVLKEAAETELVDAVHAAAMGGTYLNPRLGARLAASLPVPAGLQSDADSRWARPSPITASPRWLGAAGWPSSTARST